MTGQSGLNKTQYLEKVSKMLEKEGLTFIFETIGHKMIENYNGKIDERTILNLPKSLLDLLRFFSWKEILKDLNKFKKDTFFTLNTHAVFRWHHGLFPTFDIDSVIKFNPDMIVCLVDNILNIKKGLQERNTDFFNF